MYTIQEFIFTLNIIIDKLMREFCISYFTFCSYIYSGSVAFMDTKKFKGMMKILLYENYAEDNKRYNINSIVELSKI